MVIDINAMIKDKIEKGNKKRYIFHISQTTNKNPIQFSPLLNIFNLQSVLINIHILVPTYVPNNTMLLSMHAIYLFLKITFFLIKSCMLPK